jgi:hypothetical protein
VHREDEVLDEVAAREDEDELEHERERADERQRRERHVALPLLAHAVEERRQLHVLPRREVLVRLEHLGVAVLPQHRLQVVGRDRLVDRVGEEAQGEDAEAEVERLEVALAPPRDPLVGEEAGAEEQRPDGVEELRVFDARQLLRRLREEVARGEVARPGALLAAPVAEVADERRLALQTAAGVGGRPRGRGRDFFRPGGLDLNVHHGNPLPRAAPYPLTTLNKAALMLTT